MAEYIDDSAEQSGPASDDESEGSGDDEDSFINNESDDSDGDAHRQCDNPAPADSDADDNSSNNDHSDDTDSSDGSDGSDADGSDADTGGSDTDDDGIIVRGNGRGSKRVLQSDSDSDDQPAPKQAKPVDVDTDFPLFTRAAAETAYNCARRTHPDDHVVLVQTMRPDGDGKTTYRFGVLMADEIETLHRQGTNRQLYEILRDDYRKPYVDWEELIEAPTAGEAIDIGDALINKFLNGPFKQVMAAFGVPGYTADPDRDALGRSCGRVDRDGTIVFKYSLHFIVNGLGRLNGATGGVTGFGHRLVDAVQRHPDPEVRALIKSAKAGSKDNVFDPTVYKSRQAFKLVFNGKPGVSPDRIQVPGGGKGSATAARFLVSHDPGMATWKVLKTPPPLEGDPFAPADDTASSSSGSVARSASQPGNADNQAGTSCWLAARYADAVVLPADITDPDPDKLEHLVAGLALGVPYNVHWGLGMAIQQASGSFELWWAYPLREVAAFGWGNLPMAKKKAKMQADWKKCKASGPGIDWLRKCAAISCPAIKAAIDRRRDAELAAMPSVTARGAGFTGFESDADDEDEEMPSQSEREEADGQQPQHEEDPPAQDPPPYIPDNWRANEGHVVIPVAQHDAGKYLPKGILAEALGVTNVVCLDIRCGAGKTTVFKDFLLQYLADHPEHRVIVMSANRCYAWWVTEELAEHEFECYMEGKPAKARRLVLSLESICKGFGPPDGDAPEAPYHQCDLLFVDVCTAIAANMSGDSPLWTGGRAILQIQTIINLVRQAGQIVVADAYLETAASMPAIVAAIRPDDDDILTIASAYRPPNRPARWTGDPFVLVLEIEKALRAGKKILVPCASNGFLVRLVDYLVKRGVLRGKVVMKKRQRVYTEEDAENTPGKARAKVYNKHNKLPKEAFNVDEDWGEVLDPALAEGGAIFFTGTIQVGVSVHIPVDMVLAHLSPYPGTPPPRGMLQAIHRARTFKTLVVCLEERRGRPSHAEPTTADGIDALHDSAKSILTHAMSLRDAELPADFGVVGVDGDDTTALEAIAKAVCENTAETNRGNQDMSAEFWRLADQDSIINDGEILHTVLEGSPEKQTWDACEVEEDLCLNVRNGEDIESWTQDEVEAFEAMEACERDTSDYECKRRSDWFCNGLGEHLDLFDMVWQTPGWGKFYYTMLRFGRCLRHPDTFGAGFEANFLQGRQRWSETRRNQADAPKYAYQILTRLGLLDNVGKEFRDDDLRVAGTAQWIDGFRDTEAKLVIAKGDPQKRLKTARDTKNDRRKLIVPVELLLGQAFGLELTSVRSEKRVDRKKIPNYKYRFAFPKLEREDNRQFPAGTWKTIMDAGKI